jgi:hypothetical protein
MIGALAWRLSLPSGLTMSGARYATAPASTTAWASSGECLAMSARADAPMRFSDSSGSCTSNPHVQRRKRVWGTLGREILARFEPPADFPRQIVARTGGYTYAAKGWDLPSLYAIFCCCAPNQTRINNVQIVLLSSCFAVRRESAPARRAPAERRRPSPLQYPPAPRCVRRYSPSPTPPTLSPPGQTPPGTPPASLAPRCLPPPVRGREG